MPPLAIAGITAAATIGGSMLSASATKKAANKATDQAAQNNAANNALEREMYGSNLAILDPFRQDGLKATRTLSELLGLSPPGSAAGSAPPMPGLISGYGGGTFNLDGSVATPVDRYGSLTPEDVVYRNGRFTHRTTGRHIDQEDVQGAYAAARQAPSASPAPAAAPAPSQALGQPGARSAWDIFRDSTNYKFRFDEGSRAINQGYAAGGKLESGAALKALTKYGQDFASNELNNYIGLLGNQQGMGLNAARAVAGVGGDMVNNITANNNAGTAAAMNAALIKGNANSQMIGDIGSSLGRALGALGGSSYTPVKPSMSFQMPYGGNVTIPGL